MPGEPLAEPARGLPRRPALDGVRALAVASVVLYHCGVPWAGGGFLGVDVFFVLSGFLITSLLLDEQRRTGSVRLRAFWAARARRLLPALAVLLVTVLWVLPWAGVRWSRSVFGDAWSTVAYVSNWRFIASGQSYVDQAGQPSPLLHTWSLAIEEQWYVVLPLVLLLLAALRPAAGSALRSNRLAARLPALLPAVLPAVLAVGIVASTVAAALLYSPGGDVSRVYYGTDTRVEALLVGALTAALFGSRLWPGRPSGSRLPWLAPLGLAGLVALAARAQPESGWLYRGGLLAVAVCADLVVVGLVASGDRRERLAGVLSWRPLVALGVISYGVYLWHWPVVVVLDEGRVGFGGAGLVLLRIAVTLAVATASYLVVERPVRQRIWRRSRHATRRWVGAAALAVGVLVAALAFPAAAAPVAPDSMTALAHVAAQAAEPTPAIGPTASTQPTPVTRPTPTATGAGPHTVVFVGDSQALSLYAAVKDDPGAGLTLRLAMRLGCGVVPYEASVAGQALYPQQPLCADWARSREAEIAAAQADVAVLFAGTWEEYDRVDGGHVVPYTSARWRAETTAAYRGVLAEMARHAQHLAVVLDHCHGAPAVSLPVSVVYQWGRYAPVVNDPARIAAQNAALTAAAESLPHVTVIEPGRLLCAHGFTRTLDGVTLRTDGVHLTTGGGRLAWKWMRPQLLAGLAG